MQVDIKKVLAYSTVSQLGYMVMALGVGAWTAAVFHLFTHAFFKALLFLGAGSVSHSGSHHSFDMKKDMGGLRKYMPITFGTFIIGTLALLGHLPAGRLLVEGRDPRQRRAERLHAFMIVGLIGAFMTAAYMTRCVYLTFFGEYRGGHHEHDVGESATSPSARTSTPRSPSWRRAVATERPWRWPAVATTRTVGRRCPRRRRHGARRPRCPRRPPREPHESPLVITVPLMILAVLSIFVGLAQHAVGASQDREVHRVGRAARRRSPSSSTRRFSAGLAVLSVGLVVRSSSLAVAWLYQHDVRRVPGLTQRNRLAGAGYTLPGTSTTSTTSTRRSSSRGINGPIARAAYWFNQNVIDGVVNGVGIGAQALGSWVYHYIDQSVVDGAVNGTGAGAEERRRPAHRPDRQVQQYGALLFGAAASAPSSCHHRLGSHRTA